jgi:hypothetical protein
MTNHDKRLFESLSGRLAWVILRNKGRIILLPNPACFLARENGGRPHGTQMREYQSKPWKGNSMKLIRSITNGGLMAVWMALTDSAGAVEPIRFEIRNNADLVALCSAEPSDPNYVAAIHFCHGFAVGFARYHAALKEGKDFMPLFCFPENATRTQVLNEYVRYSKNHPEYDKEAVGDVVMKFLVETYPCGKTRDSEKR